MFSNYFKFLPTIVISFAILSSSVLADITIDNFSSATNDRFTNSASFIGAGFDFSGVGRMPGVDPSSTSPAFKWATLISSNVALSATHSHPSTGAVVDFYPGNDPSATPIQRTVIDGQKIGSTDLFAIVFDMPLPSSINFYDFATEALPGGSGPNDAGSFQDEVAFMMGKSQTAHADASIDQAVGQNRITNYFENVDFGGNSDNDSLFLAYNTVGEGSPPYETYESKLQSGDSGAPGFVVRNGELLLLGINSFQVNPDPPESTLNGSGITYTGNVASEINAYIAANAVPEPSGLIFVSALSLGVLARRRRR